MSNNSTGYPFIGGVTAERTGLIVLPSVDTNLLSAPTETWTRFAAFSASITNGTTALVSGGLGYEKRSYNSTVYRVPLFLNS